MTAGGTVAVPTLDELMAADAVGMSLALWAQHHPDAPAILSSSGTRTFAELNARANQLARALRAAGLGAGDALALLCSNRPEFVEVVAACARIGVRYTPVNWHLAPEEVAYIVADCDARALVIDAAFAGLVGDPAANVDLRLVIGETDAVGDGDGGFASYEEALAGQSPLDIEQPAVGSYMLYTSGTTGHPKGVVKPPASRAALRMAQTYRAAAYRPGGQDVHLCTGPLYHAAPLAFSLLMPLADGASVCLMDRWDAAECLELMTRHRVTHTHMVPTMFHRLLALPDELRERLTPPSLRFVVHGAAPCPVATKQAIMDWLGPVVWEYYAATEGTGAVVSPEEWLARPGTVGKPMGEDHVRILSDDRQPLPPGQPGTVYLKLVAGAEFHYHKAADKTAASRDRTHYTLGDVGYLDADGYLFLTDRSADLIISGGVNIYPAEVEAALHAHPAVLDVGVIGVDNPEWGEEVKAVVELVPGTTPSEELAQALISFCRARLAHFKCPRSVDFVDALPRRDNGKLYKRGLREAYRSAGRA